MEIIPLQGFRVLSLTRGGIRCIDQWSLPPITAAVTTTKNETPIIKYKGRYDIETPLFKS